MPASNPRTQEVEEEDQKFKVILGCVVSWRQAWGSNDIVTETEKPESRGTDKTAGERC